MAAPFDHDDSNVDSMPPMAATWGFLSTPIFQQNEDSKQEQLMVCNDVTLFLEAGVPVDPLFREGVERAYDCIQRGEAFEAVLDVLPHAAAGAGLSRSLTTDIYAYTRAHALLVSEEREGWDARVQLVSTGGMLMKVCMFRIRTGTGLKTYVVDVNDDCQVIAISYNMMRSYK